MPEIIVLLYLVSFLFEGPLRYLLYSMQIPEALYARDVLIGLYVCYFVQKALLSPRKQLLLLATAFIIGCAAVTAAFHVDNASQIMLGFKIFLPFLAGICSINLFTEVIFSHPRIFRILFMLSCAGVLLNLACSYPWEGLHYSIEGLEIEGSRQWWMMGMKRIAGFAKASYSASAQILIMLLILHTTTKRVLAKVLLWLLAGACIFITTSKTTVIIYFASLAIISLTSFRFSRPPLKMLPLALVTLMVAAPILDTSSLKAESQNTVPGIILHSMFDRIENMWPEAIKLIEHHGNVVFGRGLGGIGVPQQFFEKQLSNAADNLFLYLYATFGIIAAFLLLYAAHLAKKLSLQSSKRDYLVFLLFNAILITGITSNVIEEAWLSFFFGLCLSYLLSPIPPPSTGVMEGSQ